jgi:hypothetical protein
MVGHILIDWDTVMAAVEGDEVALVYKRDRRALRELGEDPDTKDPTLVGYPWEDPIGEASIEPFFEVEEWKGKLPLILRTASDVTEEDSDMLWYISEDYEREIDGLYWHEKHLVEIDWGQKH